MKIYVSTKSQKERGSTVIVMLVLLFLMVSFSSLNSHSLNNLKREMQRIEKRQLQTPAEQKGTNVPASKSTP